MCQVRVQLLFWLPELFQDKLKHLLFGPDPYAAAAPVELSSQQLQLVLPADRSLPGQLTCLAGTEGM